MRVAELIEKLQEFDGDLIVLSSTAYGFNPVEYVWKHDKITERETDKEISAVVID